MTTLYNDTDPYVARWLRNLIAAGHINAGDVNEQSIADLTPDDLTGITRFHAFAGIAGWDYALRLAGWPDDLPVWTGSCPCQPFSVATRSGRGTTDARHLWPAWFRLIRQCRPQFVFGEQVPGAIGHGWLDGVCADLEAEGYTCGATVLGAHSVGAPHIRNRLWWVADARRDRWERRIQMGEGEEGETFDKQTGSSGADSQWNKWNTVQFRNGHERRIECGLKPLAHGVPNRVGRLRAYGNAIVPQVAAEFIRAVMEGL